MSAGGLPDMSTLCPWACGPRTLISVIQTRPYSQPSASWGQSVSQSVSQSISQSFNHSVIQSVIQSVSQSSVKIFLKFCSRLIWKIQCFQALCSLLRSWESFPLQILYILRTVTVCTHYILTWNQSVTGHTSSYLVILHWSDCSGDKCQFHWQMWGLSIVPIVLYWLSSIGSVVRTKIQS